MKDMILYSKRCSIIQIVCLLAACLSANTFAGVQFPLTWRWSNPTPHGGNVVDMAYNSGLYVQVAERGQIFTSEDLVTWIPRESHTTRSLRGVTFLGGRIVISGESGTILFADKPWEYFLVDLGTANWLESVAASSNVVAAVGDSASIYTSTNAVAWAKQTVTFTNWLRSVAFGGGTFVTVGEYGLIATSPNGTNWTKQTSGTTNHLNRVAWQRDHFLALGDGGKVLTSVSGVSWANVNTGATNSLFAGAASTNSQLAAGALELRLQENSMWTNQFGANLPLPAPIWTYYTSLWDDYEYVVAGRSGMLIAGFRTNATSRIIWPTHSNPIRTWLWQVIRTPNFYVTVGDRGTILTSVNGIDWDLSLIPDATTNSILLGVGGTTNRLIAVGSAGTLLVSDNTITNIVTTNSSGMTVTNQASTLGLIWSSVSVPVTNDLQGVVVSGSQFVVTGGGGTILTSTTGTNWIKRTSPTNVFLSAVEAFPGGFVAVGDRGVILTSANATNWTLRASSTTNWLSAVRYINGQFFAIGEKGTICVSTNGTNWTLQTSGTDRWLNGIDKIDDTYFIVGNQGTVLASVNTTNWLVIGTITRKSLYGVAQHNGQLVTVGVEGSILRSPVLPSTVPVRFENFARASGHNVFLMSGAADTQFTLDNSEALPIRATGPLLEFLDGSGTLLYTDDSAAAIPLQFYRGAVLR